MNNGCDQFADELDALVRRYTDEADLTYGEVVGALHFKAFLLMRQAANQYDDSDDAEARN